MCRVTSGILYGFAPVVDIDFQDMHQVPRDIHGKPKLSACIKVLVDNEYPVHYDLVCQKLSFLLGVPEPLQLCVQRLITLCSLCKILL